MKEPKRPKILWEWCPEGQGNGVTFCGPCWILYLPESQKSCFEISEDSGKMQSRIVLIRGNVGRNIIIPDKRKPSHFRIDYVTKSDEKCKN